MIPLLLPLLLAAPQATEPPAAASRIDRVTVYSGHALVERSFTVEAAAPGPQVVVVGPLPLGADPSSCQARLDAGPVVVQGLQVERRSGQPGGNERDALRAELDALRAELRALGSEEEAIEAGRRLIDASTKAVEEGGQLDPLLLGQLFDFVSEKSSDLDRRRIAREAAERRLAAAIAALEQRLGGQGSAARPFQQARVALFFERPGRAELRLQYLVGGASWRPVYDVRLDPGLTRVDVGLHGEVRQRTDEDWSEAELFLSTARPQVGLDPPQLPRRFWSLPVAQYEKARRGLFGMSGADAMAPAAAAEPSLALDEEYEDADDFLAAPTVAVQDFGLTQQYRLPERVDVPADGEPKSFPLVQVPLDVHPERYLVPSLTEEAYLRAEVTSAAEAPLLAGEARVFLGPDFLGRAAFPVLRPGDSTWLNLGLDPNLAVEHELVREEREEPGVFSSTVKVHRQWKTTVKLSAAAAGPVTVLVEEALPQSRDERVVVTPVGIQPKALDGEEDLRDREEKGLWRWRIKLRPGDEVTLGWGYTLAHDEDLSPYLDQD